MINTEIFEMGDWSNYTCLEKVLKMVNDLIKENKIERSDIVEYKTENWSEEIDESNYYNYRVTISWWK